MTDKNPTEETAQPFEKYPKLASILEWFANNVKVPGTEWNELLRQINAAIPTPDAGESAFIKKHLAIIREKTKECMIEMHIQRNREILRASMQHFLDGGNVNGQFYLSLMEMMSPAVMQVSPPHSSAKLCALIAVDETIKELERVGGFNTESYDEQNNTCSINDRINFLKSVKEEIQNS